MTEEPLSRRQLRVERLVLTEPGSDRVRAVLETVPDEGDEPHQTPTGARAVRLSMLSALGDEAMRVEVRGDGEPRLFVGNPDHGVMVEVASEGVHLWAGGSVVASVRSTEDGGRIELLGPAGETLVVLPTQE